MKRKIILACVLILLFAAAALFLSFNVHWLLSGNREMCSAAPAVLISGLREPKIRTFFFIGLAAAALFILYMFVMQNYIKYKSDMQHITPDIETPKAEGQGQYGTARWLDKTKFPKVFDAVEVDKTSELLKDLAAHGYDDIKEEQYHADK